MLRIPATSVSVGLFFDMMTRVCQELPISRVHGYAYVIIKKKCFEVWLKSLQILWIFYLIIRVFKLFIVFSLDHTRIPFIHRSFVLCAAEEKIDLHLKKYFTRTSSWVLENCSIVVHLYQYTFSSPPLKLNVIFLFMICPKGEVFRKFAARQTDER